MNVIEQVSRRGVAFLNALHHKNPAAFAEQFLAAGDSERWPFLDVLPGAVLVKDSAKLISMHDFWFSRNKTAFKPYHNESGLDWEFVIKDLHYCEVIAGINGAIRCGANAYVIKEKNLGGDSCEIITSPMHLSMIFAFDQQTENWWVTQINNTPL